MHYLIVFVAASLAVYASAAPPGLGATLIAGPTATIGGLAAPGAVIAGSAALGRGGLGAITTGGGAIGLRTHGAAAPVVVAGPSGKIAASGLWGPTWQG